MAGPLATEGADRQRVEPPRRVLLVEGPDDAHVVRHLCRKHPDTPPFCIRKKGGFANIKAAIRPELKVSGREALGILVDANSNPASRWQEVAYQLWGNDIPPSHRKPTKKIVAARPPAPRVGVWLMPDSGSAGELEDFIEQLIPVDDPVWPRAQRYIDDIPSTERKFAPEKILRARIHAWLAARAEPRRRSTAMSRRLSRPDPRVAGGAGRTAEDGCGDRDR